MSDRVAGAPTLEARMDDARAVMDAVGSSRAAFFGSSEGAAMSMLFAATYPERTAALVLRSAYPRTMWAPDYPGGRSEEEYRREVERDLRLFGSHEEALEAVRARGLQFTDDDEAQQWVNYFRWSGSPGAVEALARMNKEIDVRHVLPAIRVPTLVIHGSRDTIVPLDVARFVTGQIPGARLVEIPEAGHAATGQAALAINHEVEAFLNDVWDSGGWEESEPERILATVLFTDIVGASERLATLGDRAWGELLQRHHDLVRRQLLRFRGNEIDTAGDSFFAAFDGPARAIRCARAIGQAVQSWASRYAPASTPANANAPTTRWQESPYTPASESPLNPNPAKCSFQHRQRPRRRIRDRVRGPWSCRVERHPGPVAPVCRGSRLAAVDPHALTRQTVSLDCATVLKSEARTESAAQISTVFELRH